jgi:hypothetical protein
MKIDEIDDFLIRECKQQEYARKIINMPIEEVDEINILSIKSIRQKIALIDTTKTKKKNLKLIFNYGAKQSI